MNINDLIKLATLLDANGEHTSADEVDQLIVRMAEENGIVISPETLQNMKETVNTMNNNLEETIQFLKTQGYQVIGPTAQTDDNESAAALQHVFEKLAQVADTLDAAGALEEANLIDEFIKKHANQQELEYEVVGKLDEYIKNYPGDKAELILSLIDMLENMLRFHTGTRKELPANFKGQSADDPKYKGPQFGMIAPYGEYGLDPDPDEETEEEKKAREDFERDLEQQQGMGDLSKEMGDLQKEWEMLQEKMKKAGLDVALVKEADGIYDVVKWKEEDKKSEQAKRYDTKHHHNMQVREPKKDQERVDLEGRKEHHVSTYKSSADRILNQRHCPEHIGVQMGRVAESTYQCPLDNKVYNWEVGFSYDGKQNPGGSVAAQTPDSSGYGVPHRIFDTRENTLNRVN